MIAVRGKSPVAIHAEFGVDATGEFEDPPESPVCGVLLPTDWYLIYINDRISPEDKILQKLSTGAEVLTCWVEEHVMNSISRYWRNGDELWRVLHDAQQGTEHLEATGDLPLSYSSVRDELTTKQTSLNDCDYIFDIPVELFVQSTGYRYNGSHDPDPQFERLNRVRPRKQWWQFCMRG
jgi:hypothetical protein